ncbi:unnamed protein product [Clavelina lepadiformis]|uniref:Uncharacterized protein n=1 Tax=Clavelina lepadiformis TaxID=159417 RepID=A0ABP0GLC1_CLALP
MERQQEKRSSATKSVEDQQGGLLRRWKEYFKDLLSPVPEISTDTQTIPFREERSLPEAEVA